MGVRGIRSRKYIDEPTLLNDIKDIIAKAKEEGFVSGYEVDIRKIVKQNDVEIREEDLSSSYSGYLKYIDGKWVIGVNKNHHPKRKRFTIAHEFAHYCLHRDERGSFMDKEIYFRKSNESSIEFKADEFASELLMPEDLFKDALKSGIKKIKDLADSFNVSTQAIKHKATNLGYKMKTDE